MLIAWFGVCATLAQEPNESAEVGRHLLSLVGIQWMKTYLKPATAAATAVESNNSPPRWTQNRRSGRNSGS